MEFETLHATSLRLVGRNPPSAASPTKRGDFHDSNSDMANAAIIAPQPQSEAQRYQPYRSNRTMEKAATRHKNKTVADSVSTVSGPDEERWRRHGGARRLQLLEEDRLKGGQDFALSFDCSVQRYFQVARWVSIVEHWNSETNSVTVTCGMKQTFLFVSSQLPALYFILLNCRP
jgi:hypothetical protein